MRGNPLSIPIPKIKIILLHIILLFFFLSISGCASIDKDIVSKERQDAIPTDAVKMQPETDPAPPILHHDDWQTIIPLSEVINTAGGEDSPFYDQANNALYFFFTPNTHLPAEKQLNDGATGIYVSYFENNIWSKPQRVLLNKPDEPALDGCPFILNDTLWFCSARVNNFRGVDLWTAKWNGEDWVQWQNAGKLLNLDYDMGEMHLTMDGKEIYFHSAQAGTLGGLDLWVTTWQNETWNTPLNLTQVNSQWNDSRPWVSPDGTELWFMRDHQGSPAIFRSIKLDEEWQEPQLIISQFAAEPTLDQFGNIYFAHHFIIDGVIVDADIYVAIKK